MTTSNRPPQGFIARRIDGGVATLSIDRPEYGNALSWPLLEQLRHALRQLVAAPDVRAIVIEGAGKHFVSGADVGFFVRALEAGEISRIVGCIRASQEVFSQIADSPKPVVAAVGGAAVGGGVELALACHRVVASPRASFSFPETALGILPSSGGTYRLPGRVGVELAKWLVYTGYAISAPQALAIGLIDKLVAPDELAASARSLALSLADGAGEPQPAQPVGQEFAALRSLFANSSIEQLRAQPPPAERLAASALKALASRSAEVLAECEALLDRSASQSRDEAEQAALAAVPRVFASPKVHDLLSQAAERQRSAARKLGKE